MTRPWVRWMLVSVVLIGAAHALDPLAWRMLRLPNVYEKDWGRLLRALGYLPTWGAVALAFWLQQRAQPLGARQAALLLLAPTAGGAAAEVLKLCFRRLRPDSAVFQYAFRPFSDQLWSNRGMGLPSSHTMVAFAAAAALATLFPRARWVFFVLAAGCGLTRVMATAHFLSDVVVGACVAVGVTWFVSTRLRLTTVRP